MEIVRGFRHARRLRHEAFPRAAPAGGDPHGLSGLRSFRARAPRVKQKASGCEAEQGQRATIITICISFRIA
jgi:hypothetical protein